MRVFGKEDREVTGRDRHPRVGPVIEVPDVLVGVASPQDPTVVIWKPLKQVLPNYWLTAFPDEIDPGWTA